MRNILFSCLFLFCCFSMAGKVPSKQKIRLTDNWEYLKGDLGGIWEVVRPASPGIPFFHIYCQSGWQNPLQRWLPEE